MFLDDVPYDLRNLVRIGYDRNRQIAENEKTQRWRILSRKWRNLVGEAKFDIPFCLHEYIDWERPKEWNENTIRIYKHDFVIKIPEFEPISVIYKSLGFSEWLFFNFEISVSKVSSNKYGDLPLFLAMAHELHKPKKNKIEIEEIEGGLANNSKLIKLNEVKHVHVLTESDFWNNPGAD